MNPDWNMRSYTEFCLLKIIFFFIDVASDKKPSPLNSLKTKSKFLLNFMYKFSSHLTGNTYATATETSKQVLFRKKIAAYCKNNTVT